VQDHLEAYRLSSISLLLSLAFGSLPWPSLTFAVDTLELISIYSILGLQRKEAIAMGT
jgi:hypothetical protein